jgi:hypothetical protein
MIAPQSVPDADPPAWTLYYEAWAVPSLPIVFYLASLNRGFAIILVALSLTWSGSGAKISCDGIL